MALITEEPQQAGREPLPELLIVDMRRARSRVARGARSLLRPAVEDVAREHPRRARSGTWTSRPSRPASRRQLPGRSSRPAHAGVRMVETPEAMRAELDAIGVDIGDPLPRPPAQAAAASAQPEYAAALARAYNAWLVDRWCVRGDGPAGLHRRLPAGPRGHGAGDRAVRRSTASVVGVYLPCAAARAAVGQPPVRPDLPGRAGRRPPGAAALGDRDLPRLPVQHPRVRDRLRAATRRAHVRDHGEPDLAHRDGRPGLASRSCGRGDGGRHQLGAVPLQPARQGVPRAPRRGAVARGAAEPLPQALLRTPPSRSRSRRISPTSSKLVDLYDGCGHDGVRVGLAAPRLRPPDEGRRRCRSRPRRGGRSSARTRCASSRSTTQGGAESLRR